MLVSDSLSTQRGVYIQVAKGVGVTARALDWPQLSASAWWSSCRRALLGSAVSSRLPVVVTRHPAVWVSRCLLWMMGRLLSSVVLWLGRWL